MENKKTFELPEKFGKKWLKALRSGDYKQATGILYDHNKDGYCCLGVACKLEYPLHYLKNKDNYQYGATITKGYQQDQLKYNLNKIPKQLKGTSHSNDLVSILIDMNDSSKTFEQIADWIEDNIRFIKDE